MENRIREVIESKNIKISDVIKATGLSKSYLYDVIANNSVPGLVNARKIAAALDANIDDVFPKNGE